MSGLAFWTCAGMGLLFIGLSIPLLLNKVPPNLWYGFRTRLTLSDPQIWYPVNAWGAKCSRLLSGSTLTISIETALWWRWATR